MPAGDGTVNAVRERTIARVSAPFLTDQNRVQFRGDARRVHQERKL
jgi:hypothetical protein